MTERKWGVISSGATFEALVGAIYLDQGVEAVRRLVFRLLKTDIDRLRVVDDTKDPKSRLQEWAQAMKGFTPRYRVAEALGPDHAKHFVMLVQVNGEPIGVGQGRSKQEAAQIAAAMALYINGMPAPEYQPDLALAARFGLLPPDQPATDTTFTD